MKGETTEWAVSACVRVRDSDCVLHVRECGNVCVHVRVCLNTLVPSLTDVLPAAVCVCLYGAACALCGLLGWDWKAALFSL
jgi:hypothetical protein